MNVTVELADLRALQERVEALEDLIQKAIAPFEGNPNVSPWIQEARTLLAQSEQWQRQEEAGPDACPKCGNENVRAIAMAEGARFLRCPACGTTWEARGGQPA